MIFNKDECKNLIAMINSSDESNQEIGKTLLETNNLDQNIQWAFIIMIFSNKPKEFWVNTTCYDELYKRFGNHLLIALKDNAKSLTLLYIILNNNSLQSSCIELYFELYFSNIKKGLNEYGYDFVNEIQIKKIYE